MTLRQRLTNKRPKLFKEGQRLVDHVDLAALHLIAANTFDEQERSVVTDAALDELREGFASVD